MKQHKFKIIGISLIVLIAIILGVTLSGGGGDTPVPTPPTPPTPPAPPIIIPANTGYNPYFVNDTSMVSMEKNKISGVLYFN